MTFILSATNSVASLRLTFLCAISITPFLHAQAGVTPDEARAIAKQAYIFNYPLVMMYRIMYLQAIDKESKSYSGGFGKWLHLGTSSPKDTDIVSPNNDTPYSYAWVDTRAEPWVLTMPKIKANRFYTSQWDDLWGSVLDNPGSVEDGNDGVSVLLASPSWKGELPKGIKRVIQGDTDFLGTLTRTQLLEPKDLPKVKEIQQEYQLRPLSKFLGQPHARIENRGGRIDHALLPGHVSRQGQGEQLAPGTRRAVLADPTDLRTGQNRHRQDLQTACDPTGEVVREME